MTTRRRRAALLILPLLFLAACGDDEPDDDSTADPGSSQESESGGVTEVDGCDYLPLDAVTGAVGEEMELVTEGPAACLFRPVAEGSETAVTINLTELAIDTEEYAEGSRGNCDSEPTDVDAGEIAFTCVTFVGAQGYLFEGGYSAVLDVVAGDEAASLAAAGALLPSVTVP
jgi:hypothetical protein